MRRRVIAISVSLVALASLVFAGSNGLPSLSTYQPQQREEKPSISGGASAKRRDYVEMKSDEGWQMEHNGKKIMVVVGNFAAHHNGTVITADSAVRYSERHIECFGNVLINRGSTYIYGERAEYDGNTNEAKVYSKIVKVVDGDATLYTYNFIYNTQTSVGRYSGGGVLVSGDNMLESDRGYLYSDNHEIICVDRVQMRNADYDMMGDSVVYNTETDFAQFFTRTNIWNKADSNNRADDDYLYADRGSFDKKLQLYSLTSNGYILTKDQELLCDSLDFYRDSNYVRLKHNIQIDDSSQKMLVFGDWGEYWKEPGNIFITRNPSLISYDLSQGDSLFMRSDSMYIYTHYPIREKVEKARKDSLEQAAKRAVADSLNSSKAAATKSENKSVASNDGKARGKMGERGPSGEKGPGGEQANGGKQHRGKEGGGKRPLNMEGRNVDSMRKSMEAARRHANKGGRGVDSTKISPNVKAVVDSTKVVTDSVKVATDSVVVVKTKAELRREMIDSLASDTTKRGMRLRAKLLKAEAAEINRAIKAALKDSLKIKKAERAVVLAERNNLFIKLLGEARVRDAERARIEKARNKQLKDSLRKAKRLAKAEARLAKKMARLAKDSVVVDSIRLDSLRLDSLKLDSLKLDSLKRDSLKIDSLKLDSLKRDSLKLDSLKLDSMKLDTLKLDTLKLDSLKVDSLAVDSTKIDPLAKFDSMTVKQVKAHFKAIYDAEKAEAERIKQDSLNAKLDRIGLARQAKRAEQYRKWAIRDSIFNAKAQERADEQLRRKLARMEKRGIFLEMADSATLAKVDSILLAEFGPLDSVMHHRLDSLIDVLFPKPLPSPTAIAKSDSLNLDSLYREIRAFRRVKMYRTDFQTVCDSLTMTTIDSIIHLYKLPVMWNGASQISSELMHLITRESQLVRADFEGKPLMVSKIDTAHYNQVAGKAMAAHFRNNQIYRNDVNGNVQTIYYMQEENSPEITLMAYVEAGDMTSYIEGQLVVGITYRGNPVYTFYPMDKIPETQATKLEGFKWEEARRPAQDSVFTRTIQPSRRLEKQTLRRPHFPINTILQQRKSTYMRRGEWADRSDTLNYETIEWIESLRSY